MDIPETLMDKLRSNGRATAAADPEVDLDHKPVVRLYIKNNRCSWLLSEFDGVYFFGLCDLGLGFPELGIVGVDELKSLGVVEVDETFHAEHPLSVYAKKARQAEAIAL